VPDNFACPFVCKDTNAGLQQCFNYHSGFNIL